MRDKIFISYSHKDAPYQLRLRTHLMPFERNKKLKFWVDERINIGDQWRCEIEKALNEALVAILLVSADFLASDFILNNELPPLLEACEREGVRIIPVILKPCAFEMFELSKFQCVNDPKEPVCAMDEAGQEAIWAKLAKSAWEAYENERQKTNSPGLKPINSSTIVEHKIKASYSEKTDKYNVNEHESFYENNVSEFLSQLLKHPDDVMDYYVYTYQHIDMLDFIPKAKDIIGTTLNSERLLDRVNKLLKEHGWEGNGSIRLLWFPPFLDIGIEDTWGTIVWFVKQSNNGTAFIASPIPLELDRLQNQNRW